MLALLQTSNVIKCSGSSRRQKLTYCTALYAALWRRLRLQMLFVQVHVVYFVD